MNREHFEVSIKIPSDVLAELVGRSNPGIAALASPVVGTLAQAEVDHSIIFPVWKKNNGHPEEDTENFIHHHDPAVVPGESVVFQPKSITGGFSATVALKVREVILGDPEIAKHPNNATKCAVRQAGLTVLQAWLDEPANNKFKKRGERLLMNPALPEAFPGEDCNCDFHAYKFNARAKLSQGENNPESVIDPHVQFHRGDR